MAFKKKKIVLDIEHDTLKELKRILFAKGLSLQSFLSYVADMVIVNDSRAEELLDEALEAQMNKEALSDDTSDANTLYQMIEQELLRNKNGA